MKYKWENAGKSAPAHNRFVNCVKIYKIEAACRTYHRCEDQILSHGQPWESLSIAYGSAHPVLSFNVLGLNPVKADLVKYTWVNLGVNEFKELNKL
jgi:hypothetical protein